MCVCVCLPLCVCVRARVCLSVCVFVCPDLNSNWVDKGTAKNEKEKEEGAYKYIQLVNQSGRAGNATPHRCETRRCADVRGLRGCTRGRRASRVDAQWARLKNAAICGEKEKKNPNEFTRRNVLFGKKCERKKGDAVG